MAVSIPEIKKAAAIISDVYGITAADSLQVVRAFGGDADIIRGILSGDFSSVPGAAASVGVVLGDTSAKDHTPENKKDDTPAKDHIKDITPGASAADGVHTSNISKSSKKRAASDRVTASKDHSIIKDTVNTSGGSVGLPDGLTNSDIIPAMDGDILPADDIGGDCLPVGLVSDIETFIRDYCIQNEIDSKKIDPRQFKAICMVIGQDIIKRRKILRDFEREKKQGGIIYNPDKLNALLQVFAYICDKYKQPAFDFVFYRFAGVSREYFHDYCKRGLTSASGQILKKARDLQTESIIQGIAAGGGSSVSYIFLGKALAGLQENTTITHVTAAAAPTVAALPVFDSSGGLLTDNAV